MRLNKGNEKKKQMKNERESGGKKETNEWEEEEGEEGRSRGPICMRGEGDKGIRTGAVVWAEAVNN